MPSAVAERLSTTRAAHAIAAGAACFYAVFIARTAFSAEGRTHFTLFDDAMVSMRYGRNLADGNGLVWNVDGERVEGYTNLLWTLMMALVHAVGVPDSKSALVVMVVGAAVLVGNLFAIRAIVATIVPQRRGPALAAMAATALYYPLVFWTLRGMEVGLVALLMSLMVLFALRGDLAKVAIVMAAGVLTRDDVLIPCLVVAAYLVLRSPGARVRSTAVIGGALGAAIGAHELFRVLYYDALLPNTYELKMGGIALGDRLERGAAAMANVGWATLYLPLALAAVALAARRRGAGLLVAVFGATALYSVWVGGDAWEFMNGANRFVAPAVPLLFAGAAIGFAALCESPRRRGGALLAGIVAAGAVHAAAGLIEPGAGLPAVSEGRGLSARHEWAAALGAGTLAGALALAWKAREWRHTRFVWPAFAVALVVAASGAQLHAWPRTNAAYADTDAALARYGVAIRDATSPDTTVAVAWAGQIPYFSGRPSVDLLGKADAAIAASAPRNLPLHPGHMKWDYEHSIARLRPDVIAQMWRTTPADEALLRRAGYEDLTGPGRSARLFVRRDAVGVDRDALRRAVPTL
jgi:hypothetical protein